MTYRYAATQLLQLGRGLVSTCMNTLPTHTWQRIKNLGICSQFIHPGSRAGKSRVRTIPTRITLAKADSTYTPSRPTQPTLVTVHNPTPWHLPTLLNVNVRAIKEKVEDLECVIHNNGVDLAIVSETWITEEMPDTATHIQGYDLIANSRTTRGGGIACYIHDKLPYKPWPQLEQEGLETLWLTVRPRLLPRSIPTLVVGAIYHPPSADNYPMVQHIQSSLEVMLQHHPGAGIIVAGDLNHLKISAITKGFNLRQIVTKPTRGNNILDKILTNLSQFYPPPEVIGKIATADHEAVLAVPSLKHDWKPPERISISHRRANFSEKCQVANALVNIQWEQMYHMETCKEQFEFFHEHITNILEMIVPVKTTSKLNNEKPWITPEFRSLIKKRQAARIKGDTYTYNKLRNEINRKRKSLRRNFYQKTIDQLEESDSKSWWKTVKQLLGLKTQNSALQRLAIDSFGGNCTLLANAINNAFVEVSADLEPLEPPTYNTQPVPAKYILSVHEVEKQLMAVKVSKAAGPDQIPNWILHDLAGIIGKPLCAIFNSSIREGYVPPLWRSADVCALPKVTPVLNTKKDLRPISLTPVVAKTLESFPVRWAQEQCPNVDSTQFGSTKGSSTTHALLSVLQPIYQALDDGRHYARILLIDFSKAFDHIDHKIVLQKLSTNGVDSTVVNWFHGFLTERKQRVKIGQFQSDWKVVTGGVPQGTLSGPQLFLHMVSDLQTETSMVKYVDDTTLVEVSPCDKPSTLQNALDQVCRWSSQNRLYLNASKTKEIFVYFGKKTLHHIQPLFINDCAIEQVDSCKLLGVTISSNLKWSDHTDKLYAKASKRLFYLRQLKRSGLDKNELCKVYITLIRPVIEYACEVWSTALTKEQSDLLESIQERALRIILPWIPYDEALETLHLLPLQDRRSVICQKLFKEICQTTHKLHHLVPDEKKCSYQLRRKTQLPLPKCRTDRLKKSYIPWCLFNCQ